MNDNLLRNLPAGTKIHVEFDGVISETEHLNHLGLCYLIDSDSAPGYQHAIYSKADADLTVIEPPGGYDAGSIYVDTEGLYWYNLGDGSILPWRRCATGVRGKPGFLPLTKLVPGKEESGS